MSTSFTFLLKRGTADQWAELNPVLGPGEPGVEWVDEDHCRIKIGNGFDAWNDLPYLQGAPAEENLPATHDQVSPSAHWVFDHNLGYEPPAVSAFDSDSPPRQQYGDIEHVTVNRLIIHFASAFGGHAIAK